MIVGFVAAVLAALAYGTASVLQARGAAEVDDGAQQDEVPSAASTFAAMITVSFLIGFVLDALGFIGNMVAARTMPLFVAQPIIAANLVVTALLAMVVLHARLSVRDWTGIVLVIAALTVLGIAAGEEGHDDAGRSLHWGVLIAGAVLIGFGLVVMRFSGARVAVGAGLLGGVLFGILAIAVRVVDGVSPFDLGRLLTDPAAYAVVVCGVGGFYLFTVALQTGSVSAAAASLVVGETVVPGVAGIVLLGDTVRHGWAVVAGVAFLVAIAGAIIVAMSSAVANVEAAG
ncbi:putative membrane protein [Gordonia polyisoprenivorans VH2]|uniref:Putative membrane protein n=1 Tax=Gordonia polyisoprenivorans (strain DSM 44266 / VH2) TaxID=1112204 RepID=H6MT89_GORPV|nr:DMT family transporter [Gordonia polyisoprenivorans]AFA71455.1 putative membrane protein [Gordonia polyisoprenivorans VH2]